ncbi:MAG TPA: hypothetical protein DCG88_23230 [Sphingobacterium sp.]|nr:hypothetical protein [Sphingobacterium sp.]
MFNQSFTALREELEKTSSYREKLDIWINRFGINYCATYINEDQELSILPETSSEIEDYNKMQYNLWKNHLFSFKGKEKYCKTDLFSRVDDLNKQLLLSPFKDEVIKQTKTQILVQYESEVNSKTKQYFNNLIIGKPEPFNLKIWELTELINYIDANEAYKFLCYLHNQNMIIKEAFLSHAADVIAERDKGMTWTQIAKYFTERAVQFNRDIPYADKNFLNLEDKNGKKVSNKRTAFFENLKAFSPNEQFEIINDLCDSYSGTPGAIQLKQLLITQYKDLRMTSPIDDSAEKIEEVSGILSMFPKAEAAYNTAVEKFKNNIYQRNAVDDLRLSLELLVKEILNNEKSLENQQAELKKFLTSRKVLPEIANLIWANIDNITKYHNRYVKHDDNVGKTDSETMLDMTTTIIKIIIKAAT